MSPLEQNLLTWVYALLRPASVQECVIPVYMSVLLHRSSWLQFREFLRITFSYRTVYFDILLPIFHQGSRDLHEMDVTLFQRRRLSSQMASRITVCFSCSYELFEFVKQIMKAGSGIRSWICGSASISNACRNIIY